jgi:hydroxymethylbilane synthase
LRLLRIGTRASALARWQAESVRAQLAEIGVKAELEFIRTTGDRDSESSLRTIGGKGVFIKEIEDALLDARVDLAVHSMKDVPTELPPGLVLAAICRRADVRDALVSRASAGFEQLPAGSRVGTSSLRRQAQLRLRRPDLEMLEIRGNVDTRLAKVARGDYDAIVLAKAGLDRLEMSDRITEVLSTDLCLPAAGQGAVGIEARGDDAEVLQVLRKLNHADTQIAVEAERTVLAGLEGGCQVPAGVWAREDGRKFVIEACVLAADGSESMRVRRVGMTRDAEDLAGQVAAALLGGGAERLLRPFGTEQTETRREGKGIDAS